MKTVKILLATFAIVAILMASVPAAVADGDYKSGGVEKYDDKGKARGKIEGIYMVIAKPDQAAMSDVMKRQAQDRGQVKSDMMAENLHPFSITQVAMKGDEGSAAVFTFDKPLQGVYDMSDDMAYISLANFKAAQIRMDKAESLALDTSNAATIVKLEDVKPLYKGDDYSLMEFKEMYITTPDGKTTELELQKPVKVIYSKDRKLAVIDAYPTFTQGMIESFRDVGTMSFATDRMSLSDLMSKEEGAEEKKISYERPEIMKEPAREISQKS